jgi:hypothetical protein
MDDWADENFVARVLDAEALAALRSQTLEVHEARCDRIVRQVMRRVAELPLPAADCPAE